MPETPDSDARSEHLLSATPDLSFRARAPLISLRQNSDEIKVTPDVAREYVTDILRAASDAEGDAILLDFFIAKTKMTTEEARHMLGEYRLHRAQSRHEVRGFMCNPEES
jgi:hypothetical protein